MAGRTRAGTRPPVVAAADAMRAVRGQVALRLVEIDHGTQHLEIAVDVLADLLDREREVCQPL